MIGIYKIENKTNGKKYIGQSLNIAKRWNAEKNAAFNELDHSYNYPLSAALRKYGIDNFTFEVIEECSQAELNEKERYWIHHFNSFYEGYNQTLGGDNQNSIKKDHIIGIINDLKTSDLYHREIAEKWNVSIEMVQGINTGRYWYSEYEIYPLQTKHKSKATRGQGEVIWTCIKCGVKISKGSTYCQNCYSKLSRTVERPDREELKKLIRSTPFTKIGQKYGVTDNAIRKWCDAENLPRKAKDIKAISDKDWELI